MARITDIFLVETQAQQALAIHSKVRAAEIPGTIGKGFGALEGYLKEKDVTPSATPFLRITGSDPEALEVTMGWETLSPVAGRGDIRRHTIPGGKKIFCYWAGDNSDMSGLYEDMDRFAADRGHSIREGFYEYYLNGPAYGVDHLLTKVVMLLD